LLDDLKKLSKLFGEPESAVKALDRYEKEFDDTMKAISNALSGKEKINYLYTYGQLGTDGNGSVVNERSGLS
ncbi:MAG: hypothetical protein J6Y18_03335, partial [Candidatus Methanomethylophilaceae archaeon]|nr:hypothetical protein [Candidatus Methanomethylophilaceae archaeon]